MPAKTLVFGSLLTLLAACGSGASTTGTGSSTSSGPGSTTSSSTSSAGAGGSTGSTTGSGGATAGTGGAGTGGATAGAGGACAIDPTFAEILAKPLSGCAGFEPPCHNAGAGLMKIDPTKPSATWAVLVNVPATLAGAGDRVVPGDPAHSFLYRKIIDDLKPDEGSPMPKSGLASGWNELPADQIEMLRCWILSGAKNN